MTAAITCVLCKAAQRTAGQFSRLSISPASPPQVPPVAWHVHRQRLAVADGADRVQIFDLAAVGPRPASQAADLPAPQPLVTLQHEQQHQVGEPSAALAEHICQTHVFSSSALAVPSPKVWFLCRWRHVKNCVPDLWVGRCVLEAGIEIKIQSEGRASILCTAVG